MKEQGMKIRNEIEELKKYLKQGEDTYRNEKERKENREFGEDKKISRQDKDIRIEEEKDEIMGERIRNLERKLEKKRKNRRKNNNKGIKREKMK